jgi:hypothetical protein
MVAAGAVPDSENAEASLRDVLAAALEANRQLAEMADELREENARLREENARLLERDAERDAELDRMRADLAVLQRMLFGRSSERSRREPSGRDGAGGEGDPGRDRRSGKGVKRGPGARAGRRDYSHVPRFEMFWDFPGGGYCCPECGEPFTLLTDHVSGEQLDWQVIVRLVAHCLRRYRRACECRVPATVMAPGPPKAIGKGLFSNAFIAMFFTERYVAGRSMNSLVTGLARQGADVSPATLAGTCAQAEALLVPLADDHCSVVGLLAPARRRDHLAGLRTAGGGRPGEVVAVGVHRPGHRVLRDGPDEVRGGPGPACRHRREDRAAAGG